MGLTCWASWFFKFLVFMRASPSCEKKKKKRNFWECFRDSTTC
uniref:Uncharacterized protein n=1 Tax=Rhizophora mucronata TaxID=61149 RepID=A0A2P2JR64_RHIMU